MKKTFSGVQPSGDLHLGNYLGAIKNWVKMQDEYDATFCIVDLHAITVGQNPEELNRRILDVAKMYVALGIDPEKSNIFVQSDVSAHSELCWILNCVAARMGDMEKMTQFKDKSNKEGSERSSVGLFDYPVLMAADIILYDTDVVPVGEDQVQHVELARTLARRFNKKFGNTFMVPQPVLSEEGKRIMGLDDPSKKMSKSATSEYNYITLMDDADVVRKKIKKAVTDSGSEIIYSDDKPALQNLINIYSLLSNKKTEEIEQKYQGKGYGDFKNELAEVIIEFLEPFQQKVNNISDEAIKEILSRGAKKANEQAEQKMKDVKEKIGFVV
ncbi:MAG: tryptophan--tRNA ligase [Candidatus Moraniibacteriota bacterium]|jgi:tryptophanyl-tRNA synthetase